MHAGLARLQDGEVDSELIELDLRVPYSLSKLQRAPLLSVNHHSASRTFTTNQP